RHWQGDGIIADLDDMHVARRVAQLQIPIVGIGGGAGGYDAASPIPYVRTDNEKIGVLAAEHLLARGFRHFAYCGIPDTPFSPWSKQRAAAFARCVQAAGFSCAQYRGRHRSARYWESLQTGLCEWLSALPRPLGLMACNDARARHVLEALRRLQLRVPEDVAVIGVDNDETMCELATPSLTSVVQGCEQIGFEAARMLAAMMQHQDTVPGDQTVSPQGIATRRSTDVLAIDDPAVVDAARFIRERACQRIQVADVARHVELSRSTLDKRFRRLLKISIHEMIEQTQANRARELLLRSDMPIREAARQAGYSSVQYMNLVFRRRFGTTPGAMRRELAAER
ncbi:MAG: DNA-binding transcriptional regulator, partial [Planctomycetales bacterium]|nr:DNA-binding transcriptional regulator [Planctomycetales bacterium]